MQPMLLKTKPQTNCLKSKIHNLKNTDQKVSPPRWSHVWSAVKVNAQNCMILIEGFPFKTNKNTCET